MSEQGPPAPLSGHALTVATLAALVFAGLALTMYILPANYGVDPLGAGSAFGFDGEPPTAEGTDQADGPAAPEPPNVSLEEIELRSFSATWPTTTEAGTEVAGYTAEGETTTVELDLSASNLTSVQVELAWTDDNETAGETTEPDELELVLEAPDGTRSEPVRSENGADGEGRLTADLVVQTVPENATIRAPDADEARQHPHASATDATPRGTWTAHVTVLEAGDAEMAGVTASEDEGTDWQLTPNATRYERSLTDQGPAEVREEVQTFELAPGEGMEHKVTLAANATLAYAWRTSEPVFYDFHAEPANADGFTSFETATADAATGTHVAPFEGTHGWYWENQGDEPVAITLATRGDYTTGFTT